MASSRVHLEERRIRQGIEECASVCVSLALALLFHPTGNTRGAVNVTGSTNTFFYNQSPPFWQNRIPPPFYRLPTLTICQPPLNMVD